MSVMGASVPAQIDLRLACRELPKMDFLSKSDPFCIAYQQDGVSQGSFRELGRTEIVKNNLNPDFSTTIRAEYRFGTAPNMKFEVFDDDEKGKSQFIGRAECTLANIVASGSNQYRQDLINDKGTKRGIIIITPEEVGSSKGGVVMQWGAENLDKKDRVGKSDPFIVFYRTNNDGTLLSVHKTEVIKSTLNPIWKPFSIAKRVLTGGNDGRNIVIRCFDWDSYTSEDFIGEALTTMTTIRTGPGPGNVYELVNDKKKEGSAGILRLLKYQEDESSFVNALRSGLKMHFTIAVDMSASNGDIRNPASLHYGNPSTPSQYFRAIKSVCEVIRYYNADQNYPVLGFGAKVPPSWNISYEFFLNGSPSSPYCTGVEGILEAYNRSLQNVQMAEPTYMAPVIRHVAQYTRNYTDGRHYFVLVIFTDGMIDDLPAAKEAIIQAAACPNSIIIIGIGNNNFAGMQQLDGDQLRVGMMGIYAERDIVQFVAIGEFLSPDGRLWDFDSLTKKVLEEIPSQVEEYLNSRNLSRGYSGSGANSASGSGGFQPPSGFGGMPPTGMQFGSSGIPPQGGFFQAGGSFTSSGIPPPGGMPPSGPRF